MLRYIGFALCALAGFFAMQGFSRRTGRRTAQYNEVVRLFEFMRGEVGSFLKPLPELLSKFESDVLEECGALARLRNGTACTDVFLLSDKDRERFFAFFDRFGRSYREDEVRAIQDELGYFQERARAESARCEKDLKLFPILFAATLCALYLLIM